MKKILISISIILGIAAATIGATGAFGTNYFGYAPPQTNCGGGLNLKIDIDGVLYEHLNKPIFIDPDMKPGDKGEETLSFHVNQTSCGFVNFDLTNDRENGCTGPEKLVDSTCGNPGEGQGELNDQTKWIIWKDEGGVAGWQCGSHPKCSADPLEGDNILDGIESVWTQGILTADKKYGIGELTAAKVPYFGFAWCFGEWGPGWTCSGVKTGNETQGDSFKADLIFSVEQKQNHYDKGCPTGETVAPTCHPSIEIRDGKDNDCDGQVDEGFFPLPGGLWTLNRIFGLNK